VSDGTGAQFLGQLFDRLAETPTLENQAIARWVFEHSPFDCSWSQVFDCPSEAAAALMPDVCTLCWTAGGKHDHYCDRPKCEHRYRPHGTAAGRVCDGCGDWQRGP
jgi:hypothetical protein